MPSGAWLWNLAYRFAGKQRKLAIGPYPRITLKDARACREDAKRQLAAGIDPSQQKRLAKLAPTTEKPSKSLPAFAPFPATAVRRAYARAEFWDERVKMMEWWGDKLDQLRRDAEIILRPRPNPHACFIH